jgi:RHH-type proline utilization regulon transcriptional repressor/proline dehydrogenase/delta 1-pyrroline-5-carboxylate dehydrogenase
MSGAQIAAAGWAGGLPPELGPPDGAGDTVTAPAVAKVGEWLAAGEAALTRRERRERRRFRLLTSDERSLAFSMAFCDRVLRPENPAVAAAQLRAVSQGPAPPFLSTVDRVLLRAGARLAGLAPGVVMPLTRRRLRQLVGGLVVDRGDPALSRHLRRLRENGFAVNVNLLGEYVLGEQEAGRRLSAIEALLTRGDVDYVSVKASAVASQLNLWGYEQTLQRVMAALRRLYRAAAGAPGGPKFLNLDMEEYSDLRLTVDAFTRLLDEPELRGLDAGIVLQAYLPDSFDVLREVVGWAARRRAAAGGGSVKIRIVKGANLAMESVDAAMHGWHRAPYATKAETDANYARMLDWALERHRLLAVRIGIASHNLFDVAWGRLLAEARGVAGQVEVEMLQGMAPGIDRAVLAATGRVRLYTPVVAARDFDSALAYLFRRLQENSRGENFLRRSFDLSQDRQAFAGEQARFETSVAGRWQVSSEPRRRTPTDAAPADFRNVPDTDATDSAARAAMLSAVAGWQPAELPVAVTTTAGIDRLVAAAEAARGWWAGQPPAVRRDLLRRVAGELSTRRAELLAVMAHEARKTPAEGDGEVSEAVDMAAYYAGRIPGLRVDGDASAGFTPLGVVLVTPPWNFPVAIPTGGVLAALAAGNTVVLKAPPQTPQSAFAVATAVWAACRAQGMPPDVLQYVRCPEKVVGEHLVAHPGVKGIVLTGARETARLFGRLAPRTPLFAETSGKNALVVMPDADLDLAAADLVRSAFGHAGQKCSAASLAICVGDVYGSARFRRQLVDAAASLVPGPADDPATTLAPLIGPPGPSLQRALTSLDPGEGWLLEPRLVDAGRHLWSPGIKDGVQPGSWFHQTECFGPVLGLMRAADLEEALAIQDGTPYGLTGGIHTLDPRAADEWLARVQVGNAYVNRAITGAVVQRQPFGGWKASVVGPGAKAGGPNYVAQLGRWRDGGLPTRGDDPAPAIGAWLASVGPLLDGPDRRWVQAAVRSDAWWHRRHFAVDHDPAGLFFEANVFRYRPAGRLVIWIGADARPADILRVYAAAWQAGCELELAAPPEAPQDTAAELTGVVTRREVAADLVARLLDQPPDRVRVLGSRPPELAALNPVCFVDDAPAVADGLVEGLRYRREQTVSRTLHRFGNLIG